MKKQILETDNLLYLRVSAEWVWVPDYLTKNLLNVGGIVISGKTKLLRLVHL
jgi:hypothetical protein